MLFNVFSHEILHSSAPTTYCQLLKVVNCQLTISARVSGLLAAADCRPIWCCLY